MAAPRSSNHGQDWGELVQSVKNIEAKVECLPNLCEQQTRHDERIGRLETDVDGLAKKFWWGVTTIILTLAGSMTWLWKALTDTIIRGH